MIAQVAGSFLLLLLLAAASLAGLAPSDLSGGVIYTPWPVADLGSAIASAGWTIVVSLTIGQLLRSELSRILVRPPSLVAVAGAVAVGGYVPFALAHGLTRGDVNGTPVIPGIVLTSVLTRTVARRAHRAPGPVRRTPQTRILVLVALLAMAPGLVWAHWHPLSAGPLTLDDDQGRSASVDTATTRTIQPGQTIRIGIETRSATDARLLSVRPETPSGLRAVALARSAEPQPVPRDVGPGAQISTGYRLTTTGCPDGPLRITALRADYVRLGHAFSQRLPLAAPLTIRCHNGR